MVGIEILGGNERDGSYRVEMKILKRPQWSLKWHLALVDDECLQIVPGSHKRYRTAHERRCLLEERHDDISGQYAVPLKAGQTAFWSGNLIHRGVMKRDVETIDAGGQLEHVRAGRRPHRDRPAPEMDAGGQCARVLAKSDASVVRSVAGRQKADRGLNG